MAKSRFSGIFGSESRIYRIFSTAWQLIGLNFLTLLCCLPVITVGASITAMHYVLLRMIRGEESYVARDFFKAFRDELKGGTLIWLLKLAFLIPFAADLLLITYAPGTMPKPVAWCVIIAGFLALMMLSFAFPLEAHFANTLGGTLVNSVKLSIAKFPRAFVMTFIYIIPAWVLIHVLLLFPMVLLFGLSLPGYVCAQLFEPVARQLEGDAAA